MREGPQLRVAKAARAPPCTLPILGRRLSGIRSLFYLLKRLLQTKKELTGINVLLIAAYEGLVGAEYGGMRERAHQVPLPILHAEFVNLYPGKDLQGRV